MRDYEGVYCSITLAILLIVSGGSFILDAVAVNYICSILFHQTLPFFGAGLIGILTADLVLPAALIVWALHYLGVF